MMTTWSRGHSKESVEEVRAAKAILAPFPRRNGKRENKGNDSWKKTTYLKVPSRVQPRIPP